MDEANVIGFDFGTTNSLIARVRGHKAITFLDDGLPIPSVVCYEGARKIFGRDAKERLAHAGLGIQGNIVKSPKMLLGRDSVFVNGVERSPIDIVADVVRHVVDVAREHPLAQDFGSVGGAVVTIPVDMDGGRRRALRESFRRARLRIVQFVHEPLAALYGLLRTRGLSEMARRYEEKLVLVFDWGGGTLDLTLCRLTGGMAVQLMNDGTEEVGGDMFDETVLNHVLRKRSDSHGLDDGRDAQPGARARLLERCERAKIDLSSRTSVEIYVPDFFRGSEENDVNYVLSRSELEDVVVPLLDKGFGSITNIMKTAGFSPEQVALCVATGGMSNMPAVRRRLHELFGPERVEIPDGTATLIAEGAAWTASDRIGLHLAKNVELLLARNSYLPLVKARSAMPREGETLKRAFHLYCTDPRDGVAKLQICSPQRIGPVPPNAPRTILDTGTVAVDRKAPPFRERLELDVQIDEDLILNTHARSLVAKGEDRREIHSLEFGMVFRTEPSPNTQEKPEPVRSEQIEPGSLSVRANVSNQKNTQLIPGELLYDCEPHHFGDTVHHLSSEQEAEKLYYEPCAGCGRASNDPLCRCDSTART